MGSSNYSERHYSKGNYEAVLGTFITGLMFFGVATLSVLMRFVNYNDNFMSLDTWGFYMYIPGFFILIGAFSQYYSNRKSQNLVRIAIKNRGSDGRYKLEDIAMEIGIKPKDVLRALVDLRNKEFVRYRFNSSTGEIELGEAVHYPQSNESAPPSEIKDGSIKKGRMHCKYCGYQVETGSVFCESCGSKL